ncbi:hypothetical protein [Aeropyrum camini]|uniref:Uncharacterized protein n=1 Tax=Aeropyrum camini SY1 = JCM 12091 TaxID=1198449 RepID=U3TGN0_9CREN|nr:hypothetical protein [Aeropyrum camini]BAN90499.1 hypothetical protein ACAM_1030 [Aeropyrum camini SY1 = JCM 12091]
MDEEHKQEAGEAPAQEEVKPDRPKAPISRLVEMIPSASSLREERRLREKRIRLKYDPRLKPEEARISPELAKQLGIEDLLEITIAHRHRFAFKAIIDEEAEPNRVYVNPELMEEHGVADNSIATVRPYRGEEKLGVRLEV